MLVDRGILVAAGHCDPSMSQLCASMDAGLSMFTHLGNGCPLTLHRHDNIIQRALSVSERLSIGFIGDGVHISLPALRNYLRVTGFERTFVVTDAIHAAGSGPGTYQFGGKTVIVDEQLGTWDENRSHLTGSASTMTDIAANLHFHVGLSAHEVELLTSTNPRKLLARARRARKDGPARLAK